MIQEVCALLPKEEDLLEKVQQRLSQCMHITTRYGEGSRAQI